MKNKLLLASAILAVSLAMSPAAEARSRHHDHHHNCSHRSVGIYLGGGGYRGYDYGDRGYYRSPRYSRSYYAYPDNRVYYRGSYNGGCR